MQWLGVGNEFFIEYVALTGCFCSAIDVLNRAVARVGNDGSRFGLTQHEAEPTHVRMFAVASFVGSANGKAFQRCLSQAK